MVGAVVVYHSFAHFNGEGIYQPEPGEPPIQVDGVVIKHSVLIVGYGIRDGLRYFRIKNTYGPGWADGGFAMISRELIGHLAYPYAPNSTAPQKGSTCITIKDTKTHRSKRYGKPGVKPKASQSKAWQTQQSSSRGKQQLVEEENSIGEEEMDMVWDQYYEWDESETHGRESIAAKLLAHLITEAGADRILACDLHSGQSIGFPVDHVHGQIFSLWAVSLRNLGGLSFTTADVGKVLSITGCPGHNSAKMPMNCQAMRELVILMLIRDVLILVWNWML